MLLEMWGVCLSGEGVCQSTLAGEAGRRNCSQLTYDFNAAWGFGMREIFLVESVLTLTSFPPGSKVKKKSFP